MNTKIIMGIAAVALIGASFYGGTVYERSHSPVRGQFANFSGNNAQFQNRGTGNFGSRGGAGNLTAGEVISEDTGSITVQMQNGSTKIVLVGTSTPVLKSASGSLEDIAVGTQVMIEGSANSDGSVTANSIQIRPTNTQTSTQ